MSHRLWCRIPAGLVAIMCASILFNFTANVYLFKPYLPHSKFSVNTLDGGTEDVPPSRCNCSMKPWHASEKIASFLNISLPWLNNTNVHQNLQKRHPNMPLELLTGARNKRCSLLPTLFSIEWSNRLWQRATIDSNDSFLLYSAIFDPETGGNASSIILVSLCKNLSPPRAWCHIWFNSTGPPLPVRVTKIDHVAGMHQKWEQLMRPYLLRCPLPPGTKDVPLAASLTSKPCGQATNLLKVFGARAREASAYRDGKVPADPNKLVRGWAAAVCGPALFYYHEDFSTRLVEWLELMREQGFSKVFFHVTDVHPNIIKVLRHYTQEGFVEVTDYTFPPPYLNEPNLRRLWTLAEDQKRFVQESINFNDCVLRHMHRYRFIAHFDPDEVPVLLKHDNFTHLLDDLMASHTRTPPAFKIRNSYFYINLEPSKEAAGLPFYLWALRHTRRQSKHLERPNKYKVKSLFDMNTVRGIFSHASLTCLSGRCDDRSSENLRSDTAFLAHFRNTCNKKCKLNTLHDNTLLKYKDRVGARVLKVLRTLQLL